MSSDIQSLRETGGQVPQSQIVDVPQIPSLSSDDSMSSPAPQPTPAPAMPDAQVTDAVMPAASAPSPAMDVPSMSGGLGAPVVAGGTRSKTKTILIIIGVVVLALALGFGAYYLVTSLVGSSSTPSPVATSSNNVLPTPTSSAPTQKPTVIAPMVHVSLLLTPTQTQMIALPSGGGPTSIRSVIVAAGAPAGLTVGGVRDIAMVDASSSPVQSSTILPAFFPSFGSSLASVVEPDFTSWFYLDKIGGIKLGFVFKLTPAAQTATTTIAQYIESNPTDMANLFLATTTVPQSPVFKDGLVGGVPVRFLAYNTKAGRVLEYGFMNGADGSVYLVLATSYNQMVDIISRLKTNPLLVPPALVPSAAGSSTSSPH